MMARGLLINYFETVAVIIFGIGFSNLFLNPNLIKKVIGFNFMDSAIFLFLAAKGYISGRDAPIITDGITAAENYINPVPAGLVLTGIVVSVSVTAFLLALTTRLYLRYHTYNLDEILKLSREDEE